MNLIYYTSNKGNFGDDLNKWLWPKVFGDQFLDENSDTAFLGIGSILMRDSNYLHKASEFSKKVVFGTGLRSIDEDLVFDESWDLMFLRGPFSSLRLQRQADNYITDGAYFIALLEQYEKYINMPKRHEVSVVPYYQSVDKVDWNAICKANSWNLILPTGDDVEGFIEEIAASKYVISEAMHGAIIADALRVPWKRFKFYSHKMEGDKVAEWKWNDWMFSVGIYESQYIDAEIKREKLKYKLVPSWYQARNQKKILEKFQNHELVPFTLSSDDRFKEIVSQLESKKQEFIKKYLS
ncbi:polysaccharide pyruvyl transferase family protein [Mangrovimonas sp. CR14]|uniref:polysaccharide pyruvyl transferase family protein n=1 Tax=Mangrovimonas sp. CR14 TaxID=2706120 RepID=UPI00141DB182|nr:polysaccharide pyruvyl transferase family protein [Mangrovimonas sp. CR14]NIK92678.1 polysaccharide pyruvyl transferase family protein [Mangrovimonas sp. CR14]